MPSPFAEVLRILPWLWVVNMSLVVLGYATRKNRWIRMHDRPFDAGISLPDGYRFLGNSTTWGGLLLSCLLGMFSTLFIHGYSYFLLAILVFFGHALGSFIKRRFGAKDGTYVPIIDHGDYVLLAGGVAYALGMWSFPAFVASFIVSLIVTPAVTALAYLLRIRTRPL